MALTSEAKLGPYEILSPLGAGGMGEVYRSRHAPRPRRRHQDFARVVFARCRPAAALRTGGAALFSAFNPQGEVRNYLLNMRDGKSRPVTPPGTRAGRLSPDASRIATLDISAQKYVLIDVASGKERDLPGMEKDEEVMGWSSDGFLWVGSAASGFEPTISTHDSHVSHVFSSTSAAT